MTEPNPHSAPPSDDQRIQSSADSSALGVSVQKRCCRCGMDLHGHTRYKDATGRYWCPPCNEKDQLARQPADCPDCGQQLTRADLVEFRGTPVCSACWEKRKQSAKREEARLRAVEEAQRETAQAHRRRMVLAIVVLATLVVWAVVYVFYRLVAAGG